MDRDIFSNICFWIGRISFNDLFDDARESLTVDSGLQNHQSVDGLITDAVNWLKQREYICFEEDDILFNGHYA